MNLGTSKDKLKLIYCQSKTFEHKALGHIYNTGIFLELALLLDYQVAVVTHWGQAGLAATRQLGTVQLA